MREALRIELERVAARERTKVRVTTKLILEWSAKQLAEAGSLNRLLRCGIYLPDSVPRQLRTTT